MSTVKSPSKSFEVRPLHQKLTFSDHVKLRCYERGINPNIVRKILVENPLCSYQNRIIAIHWKLQSEMGKKHRFLLVVLKYNKIVTCYFRDQFKLNQQKITNVFHGETVVESQKLEKSRNNQNHSIMSKKEKVLYPDHGWPSKEEGQESGKKRTTVVPSKKEVKPKSK